MLPGMIEGATRVLAKPRNWDKHEAESGRCGGLAIRAERVGNLLHVTSAWIPSEDELRRLCAGAAVHLTLVGISDHPPVSMAVAELLPDDPLKEKQPMADETNAPRATVARVVHFYTKVRTEQYPSGREGPYAAIVTDASPESDRVSLAYFKPGVLEASVATSVLPDPAGQGENRWWAWPPRA